MEAVHQRDKIQAGHLTGHAHIRYQNVYVIRIHQNIQGLGAVAGFQDMVSGASSGWSAEDITWISTSSSTIRMVVCSSTSP